MTDERTFRFDGWTLQVRSGELLRDEKVVRLPQQPLTVLVELLAQAGQVVTRERLVQLLWPKGVVDFDNSLNAVVRKLRVVLGDDSDQPRYIETLPRIGYRFVGKLAGQQTAVPTETAVAVPMKVGVPVTDTPRVLRAWPLVAAAVAAAAAVSGWFWWPRPIDAQPTTAIPSAQRPANQRAYELFLDGKFQRSRRDIDGSAPAIASLEAALKEDPYFADAWAALAETYTGAGIRQQMPLVDATEKSRAAALRAIELDPTSSAGHAALAGVKLHFDLDLKGAESELEVARRADDRNARMWHLWGLLRGYQGRTEEAFEYMGRARDIEPTAPLYAANYANLLYFARRYDEAIQQTRALIASQPRFDQARGTLIRALVEKGDARAALEQLLLRFSDLPLLSDDGLVYVLAGRREDAQRQVERLERHAKEGFAMSYELAILHAALGELDQACEALKHARADHSQTQGWMRLDPRMDALREQPCFAEAMRKVYGE